VISRIIAKLKEQQDSAAHQALTQAPSEDKDVVYLYGQRIGYYAGLEAAIRIVNEVLKDQDRHDDLL
jgi:hypothetical protein